MEVYLVGGAVRDELLGRAVVERDWVVVGATPAELERLGYRPVGRDFPVFLHPQTHEEYALARVERKTGPGYHGFETRSAPDVTLEADLRRRDLTINAMARAADGRLIDPYGGQADLQARLLRHVSAAFVEDPVRILRLARFAARFAPLGFTIAPATQALLQRMVAAGEADALVPERVWRETERALAEPSPEVYFDTLADCGALAVILPELAWNAAARQALRAAVALNGTVPVRWAALLAALPPAAIQACCERLRVPTPLRELALLGARLHRRIAAGATLTANDLLELLEQADAVRRPERFAALLLAAQALGAAAADVGRIAAARTEVAAIALPPEQLSALKGPAIAAALRIARIARLETWLGAQSERRRS